MDEREMADRESFVHWVSTEWRPDDGAELLEKDWPRFAFAAWQAARRTTPDREAWQPIETAPKDGTPLVMFARYIHATASIVVIASWIESYGTWVNQSFSSNPIQEVVPSHWMPRPEFPASDKGD